MKKRRNVYIIVWGIMPEKMRAFPHIAKKMEKHPQPADSSGFPVFIPDR